MRVKRIAHDESQGSNPKQNAAFRQNGRQSDFPAEDQTSFLGLPSRRSRRRSKCMGIGFAGGFWA